MSALFSVITVFFFLIEKGEKTQILSMVLKNSNGKFLLNPIITKLFVSSPKTLHKLCLNFSVCLDKQVTR